MPHFSNVRDYIPILRKCSDEEAEKILNEMATYFYNLGVDDEKNHPW